MKEIRDKLKEVLPNPYNLPQIYPSYPDWWSPVTFCGSSASSKDLGVITTHNQDIQ